MAMNRILWNKLTMWSSLQFSIANNQVVYDRVALLPDIEVLNITIHEISRCEEQLLLQNLDII